MNISDILKLPEDILPILQQNQSRLFRFLQDNFNTSKSKLENWIKIQPWINLRLNNIKSDTKSVSTPCISDGIVYDSNANRQESSASQDYNPLDDDTVAQTADFILQAMTNKLQYKVNYNRNRVDSMDIDIATNKNCHMDAINQLESLREFFINDPCASARLEEVIKSCSNVAKTIDQYHADIKGYLNVHPAVDEAVRCAIVAEHAKRKSGEDRIARKQALQSVTEVFNTGTEATTTTKAFIDQIVKYNSALVDLANRWRGCSKTYLIKQSYNPNNPVKPFVYNIRAWAYSKLPLNIIESMNKAMESKRFESLINTRPLLGMNKYFSLWRTNIEVLVKNRTAIEEADKGFHKGNLKRWMNQSKKAIKHCRLSDRERDCINKLYKDINVAKRNLEKIEENNNNCIQQLENIKKQYTL